jgi:phosphoribosylanthranilate isomerase
VTEIKFCGLTRAEDARAAAALNAAYLGVIFAGGPRTLTPEAARDVLRSRGKSRTVGVFSTRDVSLIAHTVAVVGLDVIQLQSEPDATLVLAVKREVGRPVWAVARVRGGEVPPWTETLFAVADGVLLDTRGDNTDGRSGGTFDWTAAASRLAALRGGAPLILAGGLNEMNVAEAIGALSPDIVDVSSGVESSPAIKDHERMRRFASAARAAVSVIR